MTQNWQNSIQHSCAHDELECFGKYTLMHLVHLRCVYLPCQDTNIHISNVVSTIKRCNCRSVHTHTHPPRQRAAGKVFLSHRIPKSMASKGQREMPPKDLKVVLLLVALNLGFFSVLVAEF